MSDQVPSREKKALTIPYLRKQSHKSLRAKVLRNFQDAICYLNEKTAFCLFVLPLARRNFRQTAKLE